MAVDLPELIDQSFFYPRIFDVASDQMRTMTGTYYVPDPLHDSHFALWQLSNAYYNARIFESSCGNFGSNGTIDYKLFESENCPSTGIPKDPTLTGRDTALMQKRYFGGMVNTETLYKWARDSIPLHKVLMTPELFRDRRSYAMRLGCGKDHMFHGLAGVIGIKIFESDNIRMWRVRVDDLKNVGDDSHWVCQQEYELPNGQKIRPVDGSLSAGAAKITGMKIIRSSNIVANDVKIDDLNSDEGKLR